MTLRISTTTQLRSAGTFDFMNGMEERHDTKGLFSFLDFLRIVFICHFTTTLYPGEAPIKQSHKELVCATKAVILPCQLFGAISFVAINI